MNEIRIKGARVHNLKNIDVTIPRDKFVVMTGLSGSGKSSLAFDTIYAEGQRRYVESLSAYARQFLGLMDKPDVDQIDGLSPAISIDQKSVSHNPRSTVGTVTEIYDYLRLLYARIGHPHCPNCGREVSRQTVPQMVERVLGMSANKVMILAPLVRDMKGENKGLLKEVEKAGYGRVRFDGLFYTLEEAKALTVDKQKKHSLEVVVDRLDNVGFAWMEKFTLPLPVPDVLDVSETQLFTAAASQSQVEAVAIDTAPVALAPEGVVDCGESVYVQKGGM